MSSAQQSLFALTQQEVTPDNLRAFLDNIKLSLGNGADINAPHPGAIRSARPVKKNSTILDHYIHRRDIYLGLVEDARNEETPGDGEAVFSRKVELCQHIIDFLRDHGAKTSKELSSAKGRRETKEEARARKKAGLVCEALLGMDFPSDKFTMGFVRKKAGHPDLAFSNLVALPRDEEEFADHVIRKALGLATRFDSAFERDMLARTYLRCMVVNNKTEAKALVSELEQTALRATTQIKLEHSTSSAASR